ncbi:MAG: DUF4258 domain-containing protein [Clostridia bacterium]|nr:DUF4258 domain-containing protein [Clostridia bacterium]
MAEDKILFEVVSKLGKKVRITKEYWQRITSIKHPRMKGQERAVIETLRSPTEVRQSKSDPAVYLYYRPEGKYFMTVVVKHLNGEGFIVTAYVTEKVKEGTRVRKR